MIRIWEEQVLEHIQTILDRASLTLNRKEDAVVREILTAIEERGDQALLEYTNTFDHTSFSSAHELRVTQDEIDRACGAVDPEALGALRRAINNIRDHHKRQMPSSWTIDHGTGAETGILYRPMACAGVYVPGGTAAYPSSVLMNIIPAQVAGVARIVMVTPPRSDGSINPLVLAAASELGVKEIYKIGGAQAIGALALGTATIPRVDKIAGPGNIWVTLAKKAVYGIVAIDKLAGPSEITVLADEQAPPAFVAADMLSQAEHDILASSIAIVFSRAQAEEIREELDRQLNLLPRQAIARQSLENYGAVCVVRSLEEMAYVANTIAPEHLELLFRDPDVILPLIRNAGAVFCGYYTPEPLGDYYAGANHVLPTGGTARFESPLGVDDFLKKSSVIRYTSAAARAVADDVVLLARLEGLDAHANSMAVRKDWPR